MRAEPLTDRWSAPPAAARAIPRAPQWVIPAVRATLVSVDLVISVLAFVAAFYIRQRAPILGYHTGLWRGWSTAFAPYGALLFFVVPIRLITYSYHDLYRLRGEYSVVGDGVRVFKAAAIGSLVIVTAAFLYRGGFAYRSFSYARGVFLLDFAFVLAATGALRLMARCAQGAVRRRGLNLIPTLVVGCGPEASLFIKEIQDRPQLGYRVLGVVLPGASEQASVPAVEGVPVVSDLGGLPAAIREGGINEVIIADGDVSGDALFEVMMQVGRRRGVEFRIAPSLFNCLPRKTEIDQIGALPMISLFREPLSNTSRIIKRGFDLTTAVLAFALFSPIWLLVALLIKWDSRGPVLYKQERVGMDGRIFLFYKFRTMHVESDDRAHREYQRRYISGNPEANLGDAGKPAYKMRSDARVTRVGRVLRRLSLDELPQLLNVIRGDMSVVGPRPPIPYEVEIYQRWHRKRLDMKPGLTGLWQVSGRNRLTFDEMVRLDLFYIENWSLFLDLKIILRTLPIMLRGDDAY